MLTRRIPGHHMSFVAEVSLSCDFGESSPMKLKATLQMTRPTNINGILDSKIRRRPIVSIKANATSVNKKLVKATDSDVPIGEPKPTMSKIVALKYIKELNPQSC